MNIVIGDITAVSDQSGEARVSVGNLATNKGFGSNLSLWGSEGFIGLPNGPDTTQPPSACQALVGTSGNIRIVFAPRDERYRQKAGQLAAGDRAITSNCDAALLLTQAANKIGLIALPQNMEILLDAANNTITLRVTDGHGTTAQATLTLFGSTISYSTPTTSATVAMSSSSLDANYTAPGASADLKLSPAAGGQVQITAPGGLTVNGLAVVLV